MKCQPMQRLGWERIGWRRIKHSALPASYPQLVTHRERRRPPTSRTVKPNKDTQSHIPTLEKLKANFYPNAYYHIVCKSTDGLLLFHDNIDYQVFIERFKNANAQKY